LVAHAVIAADVESCNRDVRPVKKGDPAQNEEPEAKKKPDSAMPHGAHGSLLTVGLHGYLLA
jgi:hypothetical protein